MYKIIGLAEEGDRIRLTLQRSEPVKEKQDTSSIMSNPMGFIEQMKLDAIKTNRPEAITVPFDIWNEYKWNIGDVVFIEVTPDE